MPVPIPGPEVGSDSLKVEFLMIFGRPKTGFFGQISGAPGYIPPIPASYQPRSLLHRDGGSRPPGVLELSSEQGRRSVPACALECDLVLLVSGWQRL